MSTKTEVSEEGPRSVTRLIDVMDDGEFAVDLADEFHALCKELQATAELKRSKVKGSLTIKIDLDVKANGEVKVNGTHKRTASKPKRDGSTMWFSKGGNLVRDNPKQTKLPLREVPAPARRTIDDDETSESNG